MINFFNQIGSKNFCFGIFHFNWFLLVNVEVFLVIDNVNEMKLKWMYWFKLSLYLVEVLQNKKASGFWKIRRVKVCIYWGNFCWWAEVWEPGPLTMRRTFCPGPGLLHGARKKKKRKNGWFYIINLVFLSSYCNFSNILKKNQLKILKK